MIELTAFKEQRIALALSDYLRSLGIANHRFLSLIHI